MFIVQNAQFVAFGSDDCRQDGFGFSKHASGRVVTARQNVSSVGTPIPHCSHPPRSIRAHPRIVGSLPIHTASLLCTFGSCAHTNSSWELQAASLRFLGRSEAMLDAAGMAEADTFPCKAVLKRSLTSNLLRCNQLTGSRLHRSPPPTPVPATQLPSTTQSDRERMTPWLIETQLLEKGA